MSIYTISIEDQEYFESLKTIEISSDLLIPIPNNLNKGVYHPLYGIKHTPESRQLMSESHKKTLLHPTRGKKRPEHSALMSGSGNPMYGVPSPTRGTKVPTTICPHCGKVGGIHQLKQWHFDNCKSK
jgi:hypothetical protein